MKNFLAIFAVCFISCCIFLFFFGSLLFENIWVLIVFAAFFAAVIITAFMHHETKIEELAAQIKTLESRSEE